MPRKLSTQVERVSGSRRLDRFLAARFLSDYLLVEMVPDRSVIGSIIVPATVYKRPNKALVLRAGPGRYYGDVFVPSEVTPGDLVMVNPYRFVLVIGDGQGANAQGTPFAAIGECAVIHEEDLTAVIECTCTNIETSYDANPNGHNVRCARWGTLGAHRLLPGVSR